MALNAPLLWYSLAPDPGQPLHPTALNDFALTLGGAWGFNAYNPNALVQAATFNGTATPSASAVAWFDAYGREKADELRAATAASPAALMIHDTDIIVLPTAIVALHNSSVIDPTLIQIQRRIGYLLHRFQRRCRTPSAPASGADRDSVR